MRALPTAATSKIVYSISLMLNERVDVTLERWTLRMSSILGAKWFRKRSTSWKFILRCKNISRLSTPICYHQQRKMVGNVLKAFSTSLSEKFQLIRLMAFCNNYRTRYVRPQKPAVLYNIGSRDDYAQRSGCCSSSGSAA